MSNINSIVFLIILLFLSFSNTNCSEKYHFYTKSQKEILEDACINNTVFCNMMLAIEDIFYQIQEEEIPVPNLYCNKLCLLYNNIRARDMLCESVVAKNISNSNFIIFENCNVLLSGEIGYENDNYKTIMFGNFLSELKIDSLNFSHVKDKDNMEFNFNNATIKYNYDSSRSWFQSWNENLTSQMDNILELVYDKVIIKIKDKIKPVLSRPNIFSDTQKQLYKQYTFFRNNLSIFDKTKNVTYLSYNNTFSESKEKIIIRDKIFFHNFKVEFQYALNNNITFNEGYFVIKDLCFEIDALKENNYYDEEVLEMSKDNIFDIYNNSLELWEIIISDFKSKFNENKIKKEDINNLRNKKFFY